MGKWYGRGYSREDIEDLEMQYGEIKVPVYDEVLGLNLSLEFDDKCRNMALGTEDAEELLEKTNSKDFGELEDALEERKVEVYMEGGRPETIGIKYKDDLKPADPSIPLPE